MSKAHNVTEHKSKEAKKPLAVLAGDKKVDTSEKMCWESGKVTVDKCGRSDHEAAKVVVQFSLPAWQKVMALCKHIPTREWLAYLIGDLETRKVSDIFVPKQEVTQAAVDVAPDGEIPDGCIGTIHSHNNMGAFFSQTDNDFICANHPIAVVVNNEGKAKSMASVVLQCGAEELVEGTVDVDIPRIDTAAFLKTADEQISFFTVATTYQSTYQPPYQQGSSYQPQGGAWQLNSKPNDKASTRIKCGEHLLYPEFAAFYETNGNPITQAEFDKLPLNTRKVFRTKGVYELITGTGYVPTGVLEELADIGYITVFDDITGSPVYEKALVKEAHKDEPPMLESWSSVKEEAV